MVLPTTLQMPSVGQPLRFISRKRRQRVGRLAALRDGEHQRVVVQRRIAVSQLAGIFHFHRQPGQGLDLVFAHQAACQLVPQAVMMMRLTARSCCGVRLKPPNFDVAASRSSRPRMAFSIDSGCSKISLSMKCVEAALGDVAGLEIEHVDAVVDVPLVAVNHPQVVGA